MSTSASPTTPSRRTAVLRAAFAVVLGLVTALAVWHPNWIEVLGLGDPDHGSGAVERLLVLVLAIATTLTTVAARRAWIRSVPA
jgi:hypothetical protein